KGMQQKIQFIITVTHAPKLLIFDEPFSGFDPINANILKEEILNLRNQGSTVIFSTHNMASVEEICNSIALINKAEKILEGNVKEIKQKYKDNVFKVTLSSIKNPIQSIMPSDFEIKNIETENNEHITLTVKIPQKATANDLITTIIPHAIIHSFIEILPGMNDIFINTVKQYELKHT
ncbi:MAG TPA: DUF4162 domain-containing protein, partial [Bacteroidales bacterium]|nr:DUF4162 domain-containing protein [Bacteroidales bacterium]